MYSSTHILYLKEFDDLEMLTAMTLKIFIQRESRNFGWVWLVIVLIEGVVLMWVKWRKKKNKRIRVDNMTSWIGFNSLSKWRNRFSFSFFKKRMWKNVCPIRLNECFWKIIILGLKTYHLINMRYEE